MSTTPIEAASDTGERPSPIYSWASAFLLLFVAGLIFFLWRSHNEPVPAPELKYIALVNDQNSVWREHGQQGTWLVVNFWATWCEPCLAELPILQAFSKVHDPKQARVVGFTRLYQTPAGEDPKQEVHYISAFLEQQGVTFPSLVNDGDDVHWAYGVESLPTTVLIDPQGRVVDFGVGIPSTMRILDRVEALMGKSD